MNGYIRCVLITAVMTCSLTLNVGMYGIYVKPQLDATQHLTQTLEQLPVTKKGK